MKTNKGFVVPLLLGVIALLVVGGGIYIYQNKKVDITGVNSNVAILDNSLNDISSWKTYSNSQYGFEFKYPKEWNIEYENWENTVPRGALLGAAGSAVQGLNFGARDASGKFLGFKMKIEPVLVYNTTLENYLKDFNGVSINQFKTFVTADGRTAYSLSKTNVTPACTTSILFNKKDNNGQMILNFDRCIGDSEFDTILSTFKFTESIDSSLWKTYKNSQYGFEFQYPGNLIFKESKHMSKDGVSYFYVNVGTRENMEFICEGCDGPENFFTISTYKQNSNLVPICNAEFPISKMKVGEILADKCVTDGLNDPLLLVEVPRGETIFHHISAGSYEGDQKLLIDKIISTFKFTE